MDVDWGRILGMIAPLKRQFEAGASRFPLIHHRLIETTGEAFGRGDPPSPYWGLRKPTHEAEWFGCAFLQAPYDGLVVYDGLPDLDPQRWVGWSRLMVPSVRSWSFRFKIASGGGLDEFEVVARHAWNLVSEMPIAIPIPEHLRRMLAEFFPTRTRVLPDWGNGAQNWLHLVHWIGQTRSHPILKMKPVSWVGNGTFPADEEELKTLVRIQPPDSPLLKIKVPVDCLYTESENAFMDSVWALNWFEGQIKSQRSIATIEPQTPAVTPVAKRYDDLIIELRRKGARTQSMLLEFMKCRSNAEIQDIADHVHGNKHLSDGAIRSNVMRTNDALLEKGLPIKFRVRSGFVFKEEQPE
jgi:hypothetical protein